MESPDPPFAPPQAILDTSTLRRRHADEYEDDGGHENDDEDDIDEASTTDGQDTAEITDSEYDTPV